MGHGGRSNISGFFVAQTTLHGNSIRYCSYLIYVFLPVGQLTQGKMYVPSVLPGKRVAPLGMVVGCRFIQMFSGVLRAYRWLMGLTGLQVLSYLESRSFMN